MTVVPRELESPARAAPARERARWPLGLLAAVLVYVVLRALVLHLAFDQTAMPMYELYPMGTLPELVRLGSDLPLRIHYDNAAGQLVTGVLALPFYEAFGPSYLTLKLVPGLLGLAMVVAGYLFLRVGFGRTAANVGALLLALGPAPLMTKYSLMASGNHFENLAFTSFALLAAYGYHRAERRRGLFLLLAAFASGVAVFVFLGALIPVLLLALVHVAVRGWRGALLDLRWALPAFLLGVLPLLALNLGTRGRGASFLEAKFAESEHLDSGRVVQRTQDFLVTHLPHAPGFEDLGRIPWQAFSALLLGAFVVAWLVALPGVLASCLGLLRSVRRPAGSREAERAAFERAKLLPLVLLLPITALAFGFSNFWIGGHQPPIVVAGYRYFLPTVLFAVYLIAAVSGRWIEAGGVRRAGGAVLAGAALLTALGNLAFLSPEEGRVGIGARYSGVNFVQLARNLVSPKNALPHGTQLAFAAALPPHHRSEVYQGLGFCYAGLQWRRARRQGVPETRFLDLPAVLEGLPPRAWVDAARGAGAYLGFEAGLRGGGQELVRESLSALLASGHPYARFVAEGLAWPSAYPPQSVAVPKLLERVYEQLRAATPDAQEPMLRGLGLAAGRLLRRGIPADERAVRKLLGGIPPTHADTFYFGLGWGLADERHPAQLEPRALALVPADGRAALLRGFGAGLRHVYGEARALELAGALDEERRREVRSGVEGAQR